MSIVQFYKASLIQIWFSFEKALEEAMEICLEILSKFWTAI